MLEPQQQELSAYFHYPDTYRLQIDSSSENEVLELFCQNILQGCSFSDVESCLVEYVTSIIEPVGWKAVWRSKENFNQTFTQHDYIAEVKSHFYFLNSLFQ